MQKNKYDDMILDFAEKSEISVDEKTTLVIEDTDNKQWVLYRTHEGYTTIPFGYITANIIFEYLARLKDDVHHDKLMEWYDEVGFEYDKETGEKDVQYLKPFLVKLQEVILNLGKYRQNEHKAEMKAALLDTWKMYRNAKYVSLWKNIIDLSEDNEENYKGDSWLPEEEMQDLIKGNHKEAIELESTTYNLHIKESFCFCDYITFYDKNNVPLTGRGYIARTDADIFASDLYHVLVSGLAGIPRLCPRCGHIFYPSNKSKYCDECKKILLLSGMRRGGNR